MSSGRNKDALMVDSDGCFDCTELHKVKGRFGLAWVSESPACPNPEPIGWQVEFLDTPSKVEAKCQEMVKWINCPPLPRCDPCPPDELCCPLNPPRCNPCAPKTNPCIPKCCTCTCTCTCTCSQPQKSNQNRCSSAPKSKKKCCCCKCNSRRNSCYPQGGACCRNRSPKRRSPQRCCRCSIEEKDVPKCSCDIPVKDTNKTVNSSSSGNSN